MMNCRVAGDGVRVANPAPSTALPVFEQAAKLAAQISVSKSVDLRIGARPFLDDLHRSGDGRRAFLVPARFLGELTRPLQKAGDAAAEAATIDI